MLKRIYSNDIQSSNLTPYKTPGPYGTNMFFPKADTLLYITLYILYITLYILYTADGLLIRAE